MLLLTGGLLWWLVQGFDGERFARAASDWMRIHHQRELVFGGPLRMQRWPQPALAVQDLRLSEPGRPDQRFARIERAALSLKLQPLLRERRIEIDSVSARGLTMPNVARGTVARGATGVVRGAAGLLRAIPGVAASAPR